MGSPASELQSDGARFTDEVAYRLDPMGKLMAKIRPHLQNAPITEALIDFQVRRASRLQPEAVHRAAEDIDGFKPQGPVVSLETRFSMTDGGVKQVSQSRELGVRLHSADGKYVMLWRTNGLSVSRLTPYETWESLAAQANVLWKVYRDRLPAIEVTRVATRYVNQIRLPIKLGEEFEEYLTASPQIPKELPQFVGGFTQRVEMATSDLNLRANVIQLFQDLNDDGATVVLDIDAFKPCELSPESTVVWKLLDELRVFKNQIFFAHITEKTVGLFA
ncbi:MAG: TIGR04255 family protein [Rhodospirillales bacterium]|nr:TIGR04255 family protein [Rhodospirillales bacterium]